jgi:hypothetical protein
VRYFEFWSGSHEDEMEESVNENAFWASADANLANYVSKNGSRGLCSVLE